MCALGITSLAHAFSHGGFLGSRSVGEHSTYARTYILGIKMKLEPDLHSLCAVTGGC